MKWLFLIDTLEGGGAQRQLKLLATELATRSEDVLVGFYYGDARASAPPGVESVHLALPRRTARLPDVGALEHLLVEREVDAAVAYLWGPSMRLALAALALRRDGRSPVTVVSERSGNPASRRDALLDAARLQLHRAADVVVCNSIARTARVRRLLGGSRSKVVHVPNGVVLPEDRLPRSPRQHGESPPRLRVLVLASQLPWKGPVDLASALIEMRDRGEDLPIVSWAGQLLSHVPASRLAREATDSLLRDSGLTENWRWLGHVDDVERLFIDHDVLVHPSWAEGMPNAVTEAMANQLPVIVTDVGDVGGIVRKSGCGYVVAPRAPAALASAIGAFQSLPHRAIDTLGANGHEFVATEFAPARVVDRFVTVVTDVASAQHRVRPRQT